MAVRASVAQLLVEMMPLLMRNLGAHIRCYGAGLALAHVRLLGMLSGRSYSLSELADMQSVTPATMSNTVAVLAERGYIQRAPLANDRRVMQVRLTPAGRAVLQGVYDAMAEQMARDLADFSDQELETLESGVQVLLRFLHHASRQASACADETTTEKI